MTGWGARPAASPSTSASGVGQGEQKALGFGLRRKRELRKRREVKRSPSQDRPNVSVPWLRGMRLREVGSCPWSHSKSRSRDSKPEAPSKDKRLISPRHPRPEHGLWSPPCSPSLKSRTPGTWEPDLAAEDPDAGGRGVVPRQCPRRGPCGVVGAARPESHGRKRGGDIPRVKAGGGHRRRWARTPEEVTCVGFPCHASSPAGHPPLTRPVGQARAGRFTDIASLYPQGDSVRWVPPGPPP